MKAEVFYGRSREVVLEQNPALEATATTVEDAKKYISEFNKCKSQIEQEIEKLERER